MGKVVTTDLLLHIVQCWSTYAVDEDNLAMTLVMYCSEMMYKYYSGLGFLPIKNNEEVKYIHNEEFNCRTLELNVRSFIDCIKLHT